MHRFVPSEVDARIREFLASGDSAELDSYTLLTFARRSVLGGRIACVTVARSFVEGTPAFEGAGALERFREPFTRALTAPPPPAPGA